MWDFDSIINRALVNFGENSILEIIVKYSGDILEISQNEDVIVEVLNSTFAIITLPFGKIRDVLSYNQINFVEIPKKLTIVQEPYSFLSSYYQQNYICPIDKSYGLTGNGVIVAILDTGITYQHQDFRNSDGTTRILSIWDQTVQGNAPTGFFQGNIFTEDDINNALANNTPLETIDSIGHGTMVSGICVGNGNQSDGEFKGTAPQASILVVKLGKQDYESFAMTTEFMRGIKYCYDVAISKNMPLVINISYGTNNGSHRGVTLFEEYIDDMVGSYQSNIIVATGNEGDAGHHYSSTLTNYETEEIEFDVSGGLNNLYFSLWKNFVDDLYVELISPTGETTGNIYMSNLVSRHMFNDVTINILYNQPTPYTLEQEIYFQLDFKDYTQNTQKWTLIVTSEKVVEGNFQIWLPTSEEVTKQTRFLNPTTKTTLMIPSTASSVISVSGYDTTTDTIAVFSGKGFSASEQLKPDLSAPAISVLTTDRLLGYDVVDGTSFSAPFVSGACAVLMEYGIVNNNEIFLYGEKLKSYLQKGCTREKNTVYPNRDFGYGTLCLKNTLDLASYINTNSDELTEVLIKKEPYLSSKLENMPFINLDNVDFLSFEDFIILEIPSNHYSEAIDILSNNVQLEQAFPLYTMSDELATDKFDTIKSSDIVYDTSSLFNSSLNGDGVLIGIIDTEINIFDGSLISDNTNTKIKYYLDMSGSKYGTEYNENDINLMIKDSVLNYNDLKANKIYVDKSSNNGHGTNIIKHCSYIAKNANFIVVELNQANQYVKDNHLIKNEYAYSSIDIIKAIGYILDKAKKLNMPVCIGLCIGTNSCVGVNSLFEKYISDISSLNNVCVCISNGNESNKKHHFEINIASYNYEKIDIKVSNKDKNFPIYLYSENFVNFNILITTPNGESYLYTPLDKHTTYDFKFENSKIIFDYTTEENKLMIKLFNTTNGIYSMQITNNTTISMKLHAYLPISPFISEQTHFTLHSNAYTVTSPASAKNIISVGSSSYPEKEPALHSGHGPSLSMEIKPTICYSIKNQKLGTSISTANIVGICALILQSEVLQKNNNYVNTKTIGNILINYTKTNKNYSYPNNIEGYGTITIN